MTEALRVARKKTVVSAAMLSMVCCLSLLVVIPMLHQVKFPAVYLVIPMVLLESVAIVWVMVCFVEMMRLKRQGGDD